MGVPLVKQNTNLLPWNLLKYCKSYCIKENRHHENRISSICVTIHVICTVSCSDACTCLYKLPFREFRKKPASIKSSTSYRHTHGRNTDRAIWPGTGCPATDFRTKLSNKARRGSVWTELHTHHQTKERRGRPGL